MPNKIVLVAISIVIVFAMLFGNKKVRVLPVLMKQLQVFKAGMEHTGCGCYSLCVVSVGRSNGQIYLYAWSDGCSERKCRGKRRRPRVHLRHQSRPIQGHPARYFPSVRQVHPHDLCRGFGQCPAFPRIQVS